MSSNENLKLVCTNVINGATIEVYEPANMTVEEKRKVLINMYDAINEIADSLEKRGIDTSKWFYTENQIAEMKKNPKCKFI